MATSYGSVTFIIIIISIIIIIFVIVTFSRYRSRYLTARWRAVLENLLTSPCSLSAVSVRAISTCAVREMFRLHMSTAVSKYNYCL